MIALKASEIASIVGGTLHGDDCDVTAGAYLSSSECVKGSIFLAFKGEHTDGHSFAEDAVKHGAVLVFASQPINQRHILVKDVTQAVTLLATYVRKELSTLKVIGITGSQGKTTTKELLGSILSSQGKTVSPRGNYNNELGVPITILQCDYETVFCIVEMGARHEGDIAALVKIAQPHIGVVLRVAAAHIGEFGSIEKIAKTKSEMIENLGKSGVAILGEYDEFTPAMSSLHKGQLITFGEKNTSTVRATDIELREGRAHFELVTPQGRSTVALRQYGLHQIPNALAAAAVATALNIPIDTISAALSIAEVHARWRMEVVELNDLTIINDAYNASPDSMAAAITTLVHLTQERGGESWAFLGNMRELGESTSRAHAEIARLASQLGVDHLIAVNAPDYAEGVEDGSSMVLHRCANQEEALSIARHLNRGDVILCKASRSDKLELLADNIEKTWKEKLEKEEGSTE
jgi:UDP-N-acetylmuramoyl-tripeptide--D-alanyl-D-alanine ligase